jgi:small-conductance mechanosensitive channel
MSIVGGVEQRRSAQRSGWFLVVAVLAAVAQLVIGYFYLASGLMAPGWAVAGLLVAWLLLTALAVRLAIHRSWWMAAVPVATAALWFAVMSAGDAWLGWTP